MSEIHIGGASVAICVMRWLEIPDEGQYDGPIKRVNINNTPPSTPARDAGKTLAFCGF